MKTLIEERFGTNPNDFKSYTTEVIRKEFLVEGLMQPDTVKWVYSHNDRLMVGGIMPVEEQLSLQTLDLLRAQYFLERRELGIINTGGSGVVYADGLAWNLESKDALYIGKGVREVMFESMDPQNPARFYVNSATAHTTYPTKRIKLSEAIHVQTGSLESSNARVINKLIVNQLLETCQLQMGLTELQPGSVWNTMPAHTHSRRMEAYYYFNVPDDQMICHFMGQPQETRHIWMKSEDAVISPAWSIHSAAGTSNYVFIWGMAGENLDYGDMDNVNPQELK
ncbi:MAG: 5-dehydro-4-deoxy-D-glucuronate isomerase [Bacteroidota bacterium]|nr:5-dehydro-4-deoxy-D-glucuronate isomerase [Bacteroidota bacterium]